MDEVPFLFRDELILMRHGWFGIKMCGMPATAFTQSVAKVCKGQRRGYAPVLALLCILFIFNRFTRGWAITGDCPYVFNWTFAPASTQGVEKVDCDLRRSGLNGE